MNGKKAAKDNSELFKILETGILIFLENCSTVKGDVKINTPFFTPTSTFLN